MKKIITLLLITFTCVALYAVPAKPGLVKVKMADGTKCNALLYGDEYWHCVADESGYVLEESENGLYMRSAKSIKDIDIKAKMRKARETGQAPSLRRVSGETERGETEHAPSVQGVKRPMSAGTFSRGIVILVSFSDKAFTKTNAAFDKLLNDNSGAVNQEKGSARQYFANSSNGVYVPQFDVYGPYTLDHTCAYYGGNSYGSDDNPMQMIVDAVAKYVADKGEGALNQYDCDNDGYVDNVFVFYAGHGENAGGGSDCIWPHRSYVYSGYVSGRTCYNGVCLGDYACTCELQGASGTTMSGIGPFCHEFSHVLGLPDLYDTGYSGHRTCSLWDIMDAGNYLNSEHTPPAYSAYERFYLGWLTPEIMSEPDNVRLYDLNSSNSAKIITSTEQHNLNGSNPNPTEFFMLETRVNKGWDKYLPGEGMLITKVRYDEDKWSWNSVNNDGSDMGVDIIEAGGVKGYYAQASDAFPGTDNVTEYTPYTGQEITEIDFTYDYVTFKYKGGRDKFVVTFDGMEHGTPADTILKESAKNAGVKLPGVTDVESGYTFVGWCTSATADTADAGAKDSKFYPTYDIQLFAVYKHNGVVEPTEEMCLTETFAKLTTSSEVTDKLDKYTDMAGWYGVVVKGSSEGAAKCGSNSTKGELVTPRLHVSGDVTVTMRCHALMNTYMKVEAENGYFDTVSVNSQYQEVVLYLPAVPMDSRLTISCGGNIFYVDSVEFCGAKKSPVEEVEAAGYQLIRGEGYGMVTGLEGGELVRVFDITGRLIMEHRAEEGEMRFEAPRTMYLVQVISRNNTIILK